MYKALDADRIEGGGRLFSVSPEKRHITKHSGSHCDGGGGKVTGFNKPKKHKFRKLHAVGESLSCRERRMGFVGLDNEDGIRQRNGSCARLKSPKMIVDDCNPVYHASVPRKLRSAIRKRNIEPNNSSPLRVSKKLKHVADGFKLPKKDGAVKPNLNKDEAEVFISDAALGLITKDEEEVAEALFALAVVCPDAIHSDKKKLADKHPGASSSALTKTEDSTSLIKETEISKTEVKDKTLHNIDDMHKCSPNEPDPTTEVILPSASGNEKPDVSAAERESGYHVPELNLCPAEFVSEKQCTIQRPREFVVSSACTDLSLEHGSKLLKPEKNLAACNPTEISMEQIEAAPGQPEVKGVTKEKLDTGSLLCPGLPSRMSNNQEGVKHPAWFKSSGSVPRSAILGGIVAKKDAHVFTDSRKSWKRCSTHVYISRFIKAFQITDGSDRSLLVKYAHESQKQGSDDITNSPAWMSVGLNGSVYSKSSSRSSCCLPEKDSTERLVQDQPQSGICNAALKQSQNQSAVPFSMNSQPYYSSGYFSVHPSAATAVHQVHLPAVAGSSSSIMSPRAGSSNSRSSLSSSSKPEQRQTKKWASVLMPHYSNKSGAAAAASSSSVQNWQNDLSPMYNNNNNNNNTQQQQQQILFVAPSRTSVVEAARGSKYTTLTVQQQQQQRVSSSTAPPSTIRGQYHHHHHNLASIYEGIRLMLIICNQRT